MSTQHTIKTLELSKSAEIHILKEYFIKNFYSKVNDDLSNLNEKIMESISVNFIFKPVAEEGYTDFKEFDYISMRCGNIYEDETSEWRYKDGLRVELIETGKPCIVVKSRLTLPTEYLKRDDCVILKLTWVGVTIDLEDESPDFVKDQKEYGGLYSTAQYTGSKYEPQYISNEEFKLGLKNFIYIDNIKEVVYDYLNDISKENLFFSFAIYLNDLTEPLNADIFTLQESRLAPTLLIKLDPEFTNYKEIGASADNYNLYVPSRYTDEHRRKILKKKEEERKRKEEEERKRREAEERKRREEEERKRQEEERRRREEEEEERRRREAEDERIREEQSYYNSLSGSYGYDGGRYGTRESLNSALGHAPSYNEKGYHYYYKYSNNGNTKFTYKIPYSYPGSYKSYVRKNLPLHITHRNPTTGQFDTRGRKF